MTERPLHILIVPSWYFPSGSSGLAGRMFQHHAQVLREEGHDARIWHGAFGPDRAWPGRTVQGVEDDVPTTRTSAWALPRWTAALTRRWVNMAARQLAGHIRQNGAPDLLHAQGFLAACLCAGLQRHVNVPFVYTERSSAWVTGKLPMHLMPFIHAALRDAAAVTCVSHGLRERLAIQTNRPIAVIPPHVDERNFFPVAEAASAEPFTFVTAGEPAAIKGLPVLLEAFSEFSRQRQPGQARLVLADRIPEERQLREQAARLGMEEQVVFAGAMSQADLAALFRSCHAYVSASRVETFGKAMAEALACGLPVVATPTDGARDIITDSLLGIVTANFDAGSLGAAMQALATGYDSTGRAHLASVAVSRFGRQAVFHQWESLYQSVVA